MERAATTGLLPRSEQTVYTLIRPNPWQHLMCQDLRELFRENIPLLLAMIIQGIIVQGEGSTHPESVVSQPRSHTQTPIVDKAASTGVDVRYGGATTTFTGLEAGQGSGNIDKTPTMPYEFTLSQDKVESLETDLKQTKQVYGSTYTKLIMKVKRLEKIVKSSQARRRTRIVVFDDEDDLEDPSKQGRKIDEIDQDPHISLSTTKVSTADEITIVRHGAILESASNTKLNLMKKRGKGFPGYMKQLALSMLKNGMTYNYRIEADEELTLKFQVEEKEKYTEAEQARMLVELINQRKRYFAAQRAEERRNKPPTQAQQRTYMSNYIKHMGSYTLQQLRGEVKMTETVPEFSTAESSKRVAEEELDQESSKKQKTGESTEQQRTKNKETDELSKKSYNKDE
ncbi:hypothetical protein Tco_0622361 [Tanacetum coccineum]